MNFAAEGGPDPRRRSDLRHSRPDPAQGDDAAGRPSEHQLQKVVRIRVGALVVVAHNVI